MKWTAVYPYIKSSKQSLKEINVVLFDDYYTDEKDVTVYKLVMNMIGMIPHLPTWYDIQEEKTSDGLTNENSFKLTIELYMELINNAQTACNAAEELSMSVCVQTTALYISYKKLPRID